MTDRYRGGYPPTNRSSAFNNPARASMPSSVGYSSLYAGDMHVMPSSTRQPITTPRGYATTTTANGVPTTTRTYTVNQDPRVRHSGVHDHSRSRRSTLDSTSRPPVIVTTTHGGYPTSTSSHSPVRNGPRASEGHIYTQPAPPPRSRSTAPPGHRQTESADFSRGRERERTDAALAARDAEAYRSSRPSVVYPSEPRHSTATVDYGDDGYQYTNAGELVRYDLDHSKTARPRRRESLDRGYYRPNINYNSDQRSFHVNTSADLSRNYTMNTSRPYESGNSRGGPPPSTRGFDRIDRSFDSARDVPPSAPVSPSPTSSRPNDAHGAPADYRNSRRERPVSLYQESAAPRSSHHDDYYRSREDERNMRELRDRERESALAHDAPYFQDESVPSRGFGIRAGGADDHDDRRERHREPFREEPKKRSDESLSRDAEADRERRRRSRLEAKEEPRRPSDEALHHDIDADQDGRRRRTRPDDKDEPRKRSDESLSRHPELEKDRRRRSRLEDKEDPRESRERTSSRRGSDEERSRLRDKLATGVGVAAAAVGLAPSSKEKERERERDKDHIRDDEGHDRKEQEPRRRRSPTEERDRRGDSEVEQTRPRDKDRYAERPRDRASEQTRPESDERYQSEARHRREPEEPPAKESAATASGSDTDGAKRNSRLQAASSSFNPNDAGDISKLREQLAAMDSNEKEKTREPSSYSAAEPEPRGAVTGRSRISRSISPPGGEDDPRGRELALAKLEEKMVRVVSPPRDKQDGKPLKGILKQPRARFPEEENYIREGVAPHKEDKKSKEVPAGARWTKISRKVVNPEALTVGKERFEVRDDFVIVLRVLSKEEIQAYAAATQVLRERRRNRAETGDADRPGDGENDDSERRRRHRRQRDEEDDEADDQPRERDHDRRRRSRKEEEDDEYERRAPRDSDLSSSRSFRERERERAMATA